MNKQMVLFDGDRSVLDLCLVQGNDSLEIDVPELRACYPLLTDISVQVEMLSGFVEVATIRVVA